ncbi:helix-turn-helix transcriptional regulator [Methylobacterium sp. BTF04]|uniref:helix-turn-helix transcriptional regulator n=1 Tax=Methylobacterium sp. BTF04 TaxID=2708300 RepID=UPI0013CF6BE4|nr:helix-turn-helix transcriptional regulator [Methylobacterium sp. BTF04]NEU13993.1 helix-turn-helix transcriptional regulator [Methylobacterium sp. BTF04]
MSTKAARSPLEALKDLIYEAAVVPDQWPDVLDHLARIAGAEGTILLAADMKNLRWLSSPALDGLMEDFASGGWAKVGTRTQKLLDARHAGFILEEDVYSAKELENDGLIRDFLRPRGLGWGTATAFPLPTGDTLIFSIERRYADGPVPRAATEILDSLRPHLGRAALLSARLKLERVKAAVEALEMLGLPAAILTHSSTLQTANALFAQLIPRIVRDKRERITFASPRADALLADALGAGRELESRSIPILPDGDAPAMVAHLIPMRGLARDIFAGSALLMVMTPVMPTQVPGAELLEGLFDLTAAEARIARGIAGGLTLSALAAAQGVSLETIRSQVKATFAKTGVTRQVDLARLISGFGLAR